MKHKNINYINKSLRFKKIVSKINKNEFKHLHSCSAIKNKSKQLKQKHRNLKPLLDFHTYCFL